MRTPITYYGGKQKLVPELLKLIPEHKFYVEAFMGGGALFFAKEPSQAEIINDLNGNVTNFYRVAQTQFDELKKLIDGTLHSRATYKEAMEIYQTTLTDRNPSLMGGWAFWVATNQGFGGKIGSWALARDGKVGKTLANKREAFTKKYAERLKQVQIESKDALEIIKQYDSPETFFYLDPPYFNSDCGHYKGYSQSEFGKLLELLTTIKGKFLLSSYPSDILRAYIEKQGWNFLEKHQQVSVSSKHRKDKTEVMVYNYALPLQSIEQALKGEKLPLAVQNISDMCKQVVCKKVALPLKESGEGSLELGKEVLCFAGEPNQYDPMAAAAVKPETKLEIIARIHKSLNNGMRSPKSHKPREWLKGRALSIDATNALFNSGQIHHHKPQEFKDELASVGFLTRSDVGTNAGQIPYTVFGLYSILFPLKDEQARVVNFYAVGIKTHKTSYMNKEGIYPAYPNLLTKKLYVTETILDAATLLESKVLDERSAVIALYDGKLLPQHKQVIESLRYLEEIIAIENSK